MKLNRIVHQRKTNTIYEDLQAETQENCVSTNNTIYEDLQASVLPVSQEACRY